MKLNLLMAIFLPAFASCQPVVPSPAAAPPQAVITNIATIPLPPGYKRVGVADSSFAHWLRQVRVKKDRQVYLYNGALKGNQKAQYVVLDVPVGKKDLQQCADAVMRLRAEYLYSRKQYSAIYFIDNSGKKYTCPGAVDRPAFERYLEKVYAWCGTLSLDKQMKRVASFKDIAAGQVLIKGGSPGHAVIVMDVAVNAAGQKIYLLAQSYMPAQDIHVLVNPENESLSPWYQAADNSLINTPEWTFSANQLKKW